jgi:type IV fimbrial biogenesis protein FimT
MRHGNCLNGSHSKLKAREIEIMQRESGFTITELMITIAVIAILASLAIPNYIAWLPNYRLQSGAEEIHSTLQLARATAIKDNATATVAFDTANETYRAFVGTQTIRRGQMPAGIDINCTLNNGGTSVQFNSRGVAINNTQGDAQVSNKSGRTKTITVFITGNSRIN